MIANAGLPPPVQRSRRRTAAFGMVAAVRLVFLLGLVVGIAIAASYFFTRGAATGSSASGPPATIPSFPGLFR